MRYYHCLSCHRKHTVLMNEQLLKCQCGEYDKDFLIEVDNKGFPIKKDVQCKEVS